MRTQRVEAAHTRGDLAMITRDLAGAPDPEETSPSLGSAIDPQVLRSMQVGGTYQGVPGSSSTPTINLSGLVNAGRKIRIVIVVVVVVFVGFCGLGLTVFIPAFVDGFKSGSSTSPTAVATDASTTAPFFPDDGSSGAGAVTNLHTAAGWKDLVKAIQDESGSTSVYDLVVYPTYASVGLDGGKSIERRLYRDGAWQDSFNVRTPIVGSPIDLREVDPQLIERLPDDAAQRLGVEDPTGTYLIVNAIVSDPKIMVYVQSDGGSQYQSYSLSGVPLSS